MSHLIHCCTRQQGKPHPSYALNATIYELNVRQFTPEGTFRAALEHLPRLKDLGVKIIWLMPIFPIGEDRRKGILGSYYSIKDYTEINPEFGTLDHFKLFLNTAHNEGLRVILDWVPNHTSRDALWTKTHLDWYEWDEEKNEIATPFDWDDTAKLNYANPQMRQCMISALSSWLSIGVDGFRMDMAGLVPLDFWKEAIKEMLIVKHDVYLLAEASGSEFHEVGFDVTYSWELHNIFNDIYKGWANADTLSHRIQQESIIYSSDAIRMQFTSNHDENSWNGTEFERLGESTHTFAALTFMLNGQPLIYNGQECGFNRRLAFFYKDQIDWVENSFEEHLYSELIKLKSTHPALESASTGGNIERVDTSDNTVLVLKRKKGDRIVISLFNLTPHDKNINVYDEDFTGEYSQLYNDSSATLHNNKQFYLKPWGFFIYHK